MKPEKEKEKTWKLLHTLDEYVENLTKRTSLYSIKIIMLLYAHKHIRAEI